MDIECRNFTLLDNYGAKLKTEFKLIRGVINVKVLFLTRQCNF